MINRTLHFLFEIIETIRTALLLQSNYPPSSAEPNLSWYKMKLEIPLQLALLGVFQVRAWQFPHAPGSSTEQRPLGRLPDEDVDNLYGSQFSGLATYARIPYVNCLSDDDGAEVGKYDIAILGAPFDTVSIFQKRQVSFSVFSKRKRC